MKTPESTIYAAKLIASLMSIAAGLLLFQAAIAATNYNLPVLSAYFIFAIVLSVALMVCGTIISPVK